MTAAELKVMAAAAQAALNEHREDESVRRLGEYLRTHPDAVDYVERLFKENAAKPPKRKP